MQFSGSVVHPVSGSAYSLFLLGKEMREASNYSSMTIGAHKMVPFMSSVSCMFLLIILMLSALHTRKD